MGEDADGRINAAKKLINSFEELKKLDQDGNDWLDENDVAFDDAMIWSLQEDGPAQLAGLIEANVGAVYLDYASTEHTLYESSTLKNSGVYLKENGGAGVVRQIDIKL